MEQTSIEADGAVFKKRDGTLITKNTGHRGEKVINFVLKKDINLALADKGAH